MRFSISLLLVFLACHQLCAQEKKAAKITYEDHVKPIFREHCFSCHNQNKKEGDLDLTNYTSLMQGGGSGAVIEPGAVGDSYLFALVNHDDEPAMPPEQPKIADAKIALLNQWIELGALENSASKAMIKKKKTFDFALTDPAVGKPAVMPLPAKLDRQPVVQAKRATGVTAMATSPWAPLTAIAGQKQVLLYDSKTREMKGILPFPEGVVSVLKFSRNGSLLLAGGGRGGANGLVVVWNVKNGERIIQVGDELDTVLAADISSDQKLIALGGPQKMIRVYSTADNSLVYEIKKHTDWVTSMEFSPDGVLLCTGDRNGGVHVWEAFSGREYLTLKGHSKSISGISWRSDSNIVATTSEDASIRLWEMNNGSSVRNWTAHGGGSLGVEFTRDGRLVSCGRDRYAKIWDQAGKQLFAFPAFADIAMGVTHCDESNTCFAGDWTGEIRQFNAADGKQLASVTSNPAPLETQLAAAQQQSKQASVKAQQVAATAAADKKNVDAIAAQIATAKKQMADTNKLIANLASTMQADQKTASTIKTTLDAVKPRVAALTAAIPEMKKAKTNADLAVSKLPSDAELKQIADGINKILAAKEMELKQKNTEMAKLSKQLSDFQQKKAANDANLKKYNATLVAAKQSLTKAEPALKPAQDKYAKSKSAADAATAGATAANAKVASLVDAIEFSKNYRQLTASIRTQNDQLNSLAVDHAELVAQANEAKKVMSARLSSYEAAKARVAAKSKEIDDMKAKMESLAKSKAATQNEIVVAQNNMKQTQAAMVHLNAAKLKIDEAQKATPNDADVLSATKAMAALLAGQSKKVSDLQVAIKSKSDLMMKTSAEMDSVSQSKMAAEKNLVEMKTLMSADQKMLAEAQKTTAGLDASAKQAEAKVKSKEQEIAELKSQVAKLQGV